MAANVSILMQRFTAFNESVSREFAPLSSKLDSKLQQLDDRLTALANQNKCNFADSSASPSNIKDSPLVIKMDLDRKANSIITKTQSVIDKLKAAPDSASPPKTSQGKPKSQPQKPERSQNKNGNKMGKSNNIEAKNAPKKSESVQSERSNC